MSLPVPTPANGFETGPPRDQLEAAAAVEVRSAYYGLVESLSALRELATIDLRSLGETALLRRAAEILIEYQPLDRCEIWTAADTGANYTAPGVEVADARVCDSGRSSADGAHCMCHNDGAPNRVQFDDGSEMICLPLVVFDRVGGYLQAHYHLPAPHSLQRSLTLFTRVLSQLVQSSRLLQDMEDVVTGQTIEIKQKNARLSREIEERKDAENQLRLVNERFQDFANVAADWFWETDSELRVTFLSERFEQATGISRDQVLGHRPRDFPDHLLAVNWNEHLGSIGRQRPFRELQILVRGNDKDSRMVSLSGKPIYFADGSFRGYRGAGQDITQAHRMSQELAYQARHDSLTGLLNRREFEESLARRLVQARRGEQAAVLCYLDLDQFKVINDTCGHVAGDELLRQVARLLRRRVRRSDVLARLGGDEFGLLMENCALPQAARVANSLCQAVQQFRFSWGGSVFSVGVSIGVVPINERNSSVASTLSSADAACYVAKYEGRNRIHVNEEGDARLVRWKREMEWVSKISAALEEDRFQLSFQPIVPVAVEEDTGDRIELLIRMRDHDGSLIMPGAFLPAAERYSLSTKIDRWVTEHTLQWLRRHYDELDRLQWCAINLSGHSVSDTEFLRFLDRQLELSGVPADKICFEITETAVITDLSNSVRFVEQFKQRGCRFALDDFGSGLSSFCLPQDPAGGFR